MNQLSEKTSRELVAIYNALAPAKPIADWRGKKSVLIERIIDLQPAVPAAKPEKASMTVKEIAIELLCRISHYERRDQKPGPENEFAEPGPGLFSVGLPYAEILASIRDVFPQANTSLACLRWYAVKMRAGDLDYEGHTLPQRRPRKPLKKAKAT